MAFWLFLTLLIVAGIFVLAGFTCIVTSRRRSRRLAWLFAILFGLIVLIPGIAGLINPRVEATDRRELGYYPLVELETNLETDPYVIQYRDATEFRYYKDDTPTRYRTLKGEYVELEFMTADEINEDYSPTVRVMSETDRKIYPFFFWKVAAPDSLVKTGVIRFYLKVPQEGVIIY